MKKFVSGLIIGILVTLSISTYAAVELNIIPNPYTVLIDGKPADVQGYNINGGTYLKATDFIQAGLGVNFNKDTKQIEITTPSASAQKSTEIEQKSEKSTSRQPTIDTDGSILFDPDKDLIGTDKNTVINRISVYKFNNEKYVFFGDIGFIIKNTNMKLSSNPNTHIATLIDWSWDGESNINQAKLRQIKINQVTLGTKGIYNDLFFTYEDWISKIKPFIEEGL